MSAAALLLVMAGLALMFSGHHLDRSFIIYRTVQNVISGSGFVFNAGGSPAFNDTASPLYVLLLRLIAPPLPVDLPALSNWIGVLGIGAGTVSLYALAHRASPAAALIPALLYASFPLLWISLGLDTSLWMALCLLSVVFHVSGWGIATALTLALAALLRPEGAVLAVALAANWLVEGRPFRPLATGLFASLIAAGAFWTITIFGVLGPLPGVGASTVSAGTVPDVVGANALAGLVAVSSTLFNTSPLWVSLPLLAAVGLLEIREQRWAVLLLGWAILHVAMLAVIGVRVYAWNLAPVIPALVGLAGLGIKWLWDHAALPGASWAAASIAALIVLGAVADTLLALALEPSAPGAPQDALHPVYIDAGYQEAGTWLAASTAPGARIGTTRPGLLGYASARAVIDTQGVLEPGDGVVLPPSDSFSWLAYHSPDALVLHQSELNSLNGYAPLGDPWFASTYQEAARFPASTGDDPVIVLTRTSDPLALTDALVSMVRVSDDLTLNRIGTDFPLEPLEGGRIGLVSLQWLVGSEMQGPRYVAIRIQNREGAVVALGGRTLDFTGWPPQTLVTSYHPVELAPEPSPGVYDLTVGLGADAFDVTWYPVARGKVPFESAVFLGGISGTRADFGEIALLGYRLADTAEGLEVLLLWQANTVPVADYRVMIQVRDGQGTIVAQLDTEPFNGAYPTSIWSAGEQVPDTYHMDVSSLPPGDYEVYAGLIDPDGQRLLTRDGQDALLIGRVNVSPE